MKTSLAPMVSMLAAIVALVGAEPARAETVRFSDPELCELAGWVVIGKTISATYGIHSATGFATTTATIEVERVAHGTPPPQFPLTVLGGVINGQRRVVGGEPKLDVGSRHLFLLAPRPGGPPMLIAGMDGAVRLDPTVALPSNADLEATWESHCVNY